MEGLMGSESVGGVERSQCGSTSLRLDCDSDFDLGGGRGGVTHICRLTSCVKKSKISRKVRM